MVRFKRSGLGACFKQNNKVFGKKHIPLTKINLKELFVENEVSCKFKKSNNWETTKSFKSYFLFPQNERPQNHLFLTIRKLLSHFTNTKLIFSITTHDLTFSLPEYFSFFSLNLIVKI